MITELEMCCAPGETIAEPGEGIGLSRDGHFVRFMEIHYGQLTGSVRNTINHFVRANHADFDIDELVADALHAWLNTVNAKLFEWADRDFEHWAAGAFQTGKNHAMQAAQKALAAPLTDQIAEDHFHPQFDGLELAAYKFRKLVNAYPGVNDGIVQTIARKAAKDDEYREIVAAAFEDCQKHRQVRFEPLLAGLLQWRDWAADRIRAGMNLSVRKALELGLFRSGNVAAREMGAWWLVRRRPEMRTVCTVQVAALGLVDYLPSGQQRAAGLLIERWVAGNPNNLSAANFGCDVNGCVHSAPLFGIDLRNLALEGTVKQGGK